MSQLTVQSKRLYEVSEPISIATKLNQIAAEFKSSGWNVKRGIAGVVILTLQDGEVHYIPTLKGIEEVIYKRENK